MPNQLTYPGVYIEEVPSRSRTVSGASTSVTAFIGRAKRGISNEPIRIQSFGEYERVFGGLWRNSSMSYAVYHYFLNGGGDAVVNRIHNNAASAVLTLPCGAGTKDAPASTITLNAASEGEWGNNIRARVDYEISEDIAKTYGLETTALFNLTVYDGNTGAIEEFRNVSVADSPRRIDEVLKNQSKLVCVGGALPDAIPNAHTAPVSGKTLWNDDKASVAAVNGSDGDEPTFTQYLGNEAKKEGIYAFDKIDIFNMMCIPPISDLKDSLYDASGKESSVLTAAASYCKTRKAMLIMDTPNTWTDKTKAVEGYKALGVSDENAAIFFPRIIMADPLQESRSREFSPCGAIAGVFARTDAERGIWKAPAGIGATLKGVQGLSVRLTDGEHGQLNPLGVNCLRTFPAVGSVIYGSRTCKGADSLASEFKYIPVRRLTLYIEESLYRGTQFAVFEPNDEPLWADIRFSVTSFMQGLFRQGAFQGSTAKEAYFVKCDSETTTQDDINRGVVNILVGFAPLKPAEFIVIKIQQISEQK